MPEMEIAPYGAWKSTITADLVISGVVGLAEIVLDGTDVYWIESRPAEGGRSVIVRRTPDGKRADVTPAPLNARTRVHEYGGGAYTVLAGTIFFANFADQRLYRQDPGGAPRPISPEAPLRYADFAVDRQRGRLICVREDHALAGRQATNTLVSVEMAGDTGGGKILTAGNDFYASPAISPDGMRLAWLTWNHPNMPWDGCELWIGELLADGMVGSAQRVAGGAEESIFQPQWAPNGDLYFVSDRTGWWNLYRRRGAEIDRIVALEAEFGGPQWAFGLSTYAVDPAGDIVCTYVRDGVSFLARVDVSARRLIPIETPFTVISGVRAAGRSAVFLAASPTTLPAVVKLDGTTGRMETLGRAGELTLDESTLSMPQPIEFATEHGLTSHAFFYPPANPQYTAPAGERPPLLVMSHGGPTGHSSPRLVLAMQYWTSRGFGVLDVNYGGSTGYGRAYRSRLDGQWGIVDVDDCVNGARALVARGAADGNRLAIRGGSAGGYTTLCALTFRDLFRAGASHFGIADVEALARDTHKFESRYLDRMIGPYPERRDLYVARSPIHFTERLSCALIVFQGLDDQVVPPNQAEMMFAAVRAKGLPVAYLAYAGEGHGFRRAENIKRTLEAELYFYSRVFGFELAEPVEPVQIENL